MSGTTLIQQRAIQLYTGIKTELSDLKTFVNKPNVVLFCTILTKAAAAVEAYKLNDVSLSSAEKQATAIAIGRLFIIDIKGINSPDITEYDVLAVNMIELLIGFSNELVTIGKNIKTKFFSLSCFDKCK